MLENTSCDIQLIDCSFPFFAPISADLAKYEIGKLLGSGSFGQVVAATRKSDDKPVCVLLSEYWI